MKLLTCPINGTRPISEFICGGDVEPDLDPQSCSDAEWAAHVFNRPQNTPCVKREWWCHTPSVTWFIVERDTGSDRIHKTYLYSDLVEGRV